MLCGDEQESELEERAREISQSVNRNDILTEIVKEREEEDKSKECWIDEWKMKNEWKIEITIWEMNC